MQFAVVLDVEQIAMRQQVRQADRIATQPEIGDENLVAAMPLSTSAVAIRSSKIAGARIQGQGDHEAIRRGGRQPHAWLYRPVEYLRRPGRCPREQGWCR
jgi:hypothetical protein